MDDSSGVDICRVCRSEGLPERPLFHPCICTGSIKWIHQECLVQWMRYSRKEYCELCSHRFSFTPIYSPDMPRRLPLKDVARGLLSSITTALKYWFHYTLVAVAWLGVVPLTACRIYRGLFSGSLESITTLPFDIIKIQNIPSDVFHGCFVITCTLFAFVGMVWLREQIVHGGGPDWLEPEQEQVEQEEPNQQFENDNLPLQEVANLVRQPTDFNNDNNNNNNSNNNNVGNNNARYEVNGFQNASETVAHGIENDTVDEPLVTVPSSSNDTSNSTDRNDGSESFEYFADQHNQEHVDEASNNFSSSICDVDNDVNIGHSYLSNDNTEADENNEYVNDLNDEVEEHEYDVHPEEHNFNQALNADLEVHRNAEPVIEMHHGEAIEGGVGGQDDGNWNPIEWDRAVEELTWERLLGLDGSLVFLEHVFWVMSLNTLFIIVFAFLPYHFGNFAIRGLGLRDGTGGTHFEGLITTLCGYCIIGLCLVILHTFASLLGLRKSKRILGLCYVIVKVSLLSVVEIGVLPLVCGWWLDICSLSMFDATLKDRETSFRLAPGTSMFIHWLVGMVYVYYFASFIILLREVVRPGVLWFLVNLNDPDFSPIQEMIHTPIIHHIRRLLVSSIIFGSAVILMLWMPVRIIRYLWPKFLPYSVSLQIETQMNELSLELMLLQVILPGLLEQSQTRIWMKDLVRLWCKCAAWIFGVHSYLLGEETEQNGNVEQAENNADNNQNNIFNGLGAVHQALLPREGPIGVQSYQRPSWFYARLIGLLIAVCFSLVIASLIALTLPVWIGRRIMSLCLVGTANPSPSVNPVSGVAEEALERVHELYTAASGTYLCWLIARAITILRKLLPQGRAAILDTEKMRQWCFWGAKSVIAFTFLLGIIPLLFGLLLEFVIVVPVRVPLNQTPVLFVWQDWVLGVLYTKISCAMIMMGPDWRMRRAIERVYRDGIRNMDLPFILSDLVIPATTLFSLALAIPYAVAHSVIPLVVSNLESRNIIARLLYPFVLIAFILSGLVALQIRQFKKLYEHIKNDKYLVGKRLVNYDHRMSRNPDGF